MSAYMATKATTKATTMTSIKIGTKRRRAASRGLGLALVGLLALALSAPLAEAITLKGKTLRPNASPKPRTLVQLLAKGEKGYRVAYQTRSFTDGSFIFQEVTPGKYVLRVNQRQNYKLTLPEGNFMELPPVVVERK